ncbi:MAG: lipid-A-disaccharide synthase [Magnetococcales bacterium]|nr:lipid-A-disaccharide synthase [Magnetococcales bacterium]MBF0155970.1 lipid-A-disaccharide synthase [Magnetococcales bacterium]
MSDDSATAQASIMMVAGEASGDLLGAMLLEELRSLLSRPVEAMGIGGPRMQAQGFVSHGEMNQLSVIGVAEVIGRLPGLIRLFRRLVALLRERRPQLLVTIDLPDFNLLLAGRARSLGIPVVHYVSPQVWAWRRGRVRRIAAKVDHLLALFPFEPAIYEGSALPVTFVGHPLARLIQTAEPGSGEAWEERQRLRRDAGVGEGESLVAILPGSRLSEWHRHAGLMVTACERLRQGRPGTHFVLALADNLSSHLAKDFPWLVVKGRTQAVLAAADAALVASGTATLEAALVGTPMVVVYRTSWATYEIGRRVIRVDSISLVNLVAGRVLVPERIQGEATPEILAHDLSRILDDPSVAARMRQGFAEIRSKLAAPARSAAAVVADFLLHRPGVPVDGGA